MEKIIQSGLDPELQVLDPLGRLDAQGRVRNIRLADLTTPYLGFTGILNRWDSSAMSVRHAGYASVQRRAGRGLSFTANYTLGKSIDTASSAGDSILNSGFSTATLLQMSFGGSKSAERAVANYDVTHNFTSTFNWELPLGRGHALLGGAPRFVNAIVGGWHMNGIGTARSGLPMQAAIGWSNYFGSTLNAFSRVRVDQVPGVPLRNPDYDRQNCAYANGCEPWFNPAAFMLPAKGQLGNSARVISKARFPWRYTYDSSLQKNFYLSKERNRYLQFRADIFNLFNHANMKHEPNMNTFNMFNQPSETDLTAAEYNAWVAANPSRGLRPQSGSTPNPDYQRVLDVTRQARGTSFALPNDFFALRLPRKFASSKATDYDITTREGLALYRLRSVYRPQFGGFKAFPPETFNPMRHFQFAIKLYF